MRGLLGTGYEPSLITTYSAPVFLLFFVLIVWLVYRKKSRSKYEEYSKIPLDHETTVQD